MRNTLELQIFAKKDWNREKIKKFSVLGQNSFLLKLEACNLKTTWGKSRNSQELGILRKQEFYATFGEIHKRNDWY